MFVDSIWKWNLLNIEKIPLFSPILMNYLIFPQNAYINEEKIKTQEDLNKYMTEEDKFIYAIQEITEEETIYLNNLIMKKLIVL